MKEAESRKLPMGKSTASSKGYLRGLYNFLIKYNVLALLGAKVAFSLKNTKWALWTLIPQPPDIMRYFQAHIQKVEAGQIIASTKFLCGYVYICVLVCVCVYIYVCICMCVPFYNCNIYNSNISYLECTGLHEHSEQKNQNPGQILFQTSSDLWWDTQIDPIEI